MNVLSLFDGISCAYVALKRTGIPIQNYYACEIDKYAIQVSKKNTEIQHLGSVVDLAPIPNLDLLIGGSPCQDLSIAKKGRKGLDGERSGLFWEYVRILKESKPKYFILENVASMPKEAKEIITKELGVEPILINAALVSAQNRKRLFWTNIPVQGLPEDKGILLKDILQPNTEVDERMISKGKAFTLTASYNGAVVENSIKRKQRTMVKFTKSKEKFTPTTRKLGYIGDKDHQATRVYDIEGKAPALNTICNNGLIKLGFVGKGGSNNQGGQALRVYSSDGKSVTLGSSGAGLIKVGHIGKTDGQGSRVYSTEGKSVCLSANGGGGGAKTGLYETDGIRKLDPIECERLQGLPDNYTEGISNTQRYKCLGNAFNVDVICHILSFMKKL
jgi:DNA (cytosine-5)-methyltransferase 3A